MKPTSHTSFQQAETYLRTAVLSIASLTGTSLGGGDIDRVVAEAMRSIRAGALVNPHVSLSPETLLSSTVLGQVEREVKQIKLAANGPLNITGVPRKDGGDDYPFHEGRYQGGQFIRSLTAQGVDRDKSASRSTRYAGELPGASVPGNSDLRGVSLADYFTSPLTRMIVDSGMSYGTFDHLRRGGFDRSNIHDAIKDARGLGFDVNNKRGMKNLSVIRKDGDDPDETVRRIKTFKDALEKDEAFRKAVEEHETAKTPEEKEKVMERINKIAGEHAKKQGIPADMEKQRSEAVRKAIGETTEEAKNKAIEKLRKTAPTNVLTNQKADAKMAEVDPAAKAAAQKALEAILKKNKLEPRS